MDQRGVALYLVVALLAILGFLAVSSTWIAGQHAQSAQETWVQAEAFSAESFVLRELFLGYLTEVQNDLRDAIFTNANLNATTYLSDPYAVARSAQAALSQNGCPTGTLGKPSGRAALWTAYFFLDGDATVCGKTLASLSLSLPAPYRAEGADRTTWRVGFFTSSNAPMQTYVFPIMVVLEIVDSGTGLTSISAYRGDYRVLLGKPHPGWWAVAAYGNRIPLGPGWDLRGPVYSAPSPQLTPPLFLNGSLHTARCAPPVGSSCTQETNMHFKGQTYDYRNLTPSPWSPCASDGCVRVAMGIDWNAPFLSRPAPTGTGATTSVTLSDPNPVISFSTNGSSQTITVTSGASTKTYTISRGTNGGFLLSTNPLLGERPTFDFLINAQYNVTVNGGSLTTNPDFASRVRITIQAPNHTVAGNLTGSPDPCQTSPTFSCTKPVLPVLFSASNTLTLQASQVHATMLAPTLNISTNQAYIYGGLNFSSLTLPSQYSLAVNANPAAAEAPFPSFPGATFSQPGSLTFTGFSKVR